MALGAAVGQAVDLQERLESAEGEAVALRQRVAALEASAGAREASPAPSGAPEV
jgi:hypothetical protein